MDPQLEELIEAGDPGDYVRVVARFGADASPPDGVEVISQFGDVATVRAPRGRLQDIRDAPGVVSLKAPRLLDEHQMAPEVPAQERAYDVEDERRPEHLPETGRNIVVGCADWGLDFAHPDFRTANGETRLLGLWDQRGGERTDGGSRHGYGVVHDRAAINRALQATDPYATLGYHPADADLGTGSHGTHCLSIAAGSGSQNTPIGMAPGAELVFVHLDSPAAGREQRSLGDSVTLIDAIDFCIRADAAAPTVVSLSLGSHGGPHDGTSLVERAIDNAVTESVGRAICQSAGNYYEKHVHTCGRLRPGDVRRIGWLTERAESNPHQLEVWYSASDLIVASFRAPEGTVEVTVAPGESQELSIRGTTIARIYHRTREPNNGKNHINAFLYPAAPGGRWEVSLSAIDMADGRYQCWVERESACPSCQSHIDETEVVKESTTGSVCNGLRTIAVGAYDAHSPERSLAPFSSAGMTVDGRIVPGLAAPGVQVLAARSTPRGETPGARSTRMSGTSMAAPHVAGTVALMFEAAGRPLAIAETRRALSETAEAAGFTDERALRIGDGYLDVQRAIGAVRADRRSAAQRNGARRAPEAHPVPEVPSTHAETDAGSPDAGSRQYDAAVAEWLAEGVAEAPQLDGAAADPELLGLQADTAPMEPSELEDLPGADREASDGAVEAVQPSLEGNPLVGALVHRGQHSEVEETDLENIAHQAAQQDASVTGAVLGEIGAQSPADLFDRLDRGAGNGGPPGNYALVAGPGETLAVEPRAGDVVLSRVRGERDLGRLGVVARGGLADWAEARAGGRLVRDAGPGLYAEVFTDGPEGGDVVAMRVADPAGRVGVENMVLRAAPAAQNVVAEQETTFWQGERWPGVIGEQDLEWAPEAGPIAAGRLVVDQVPLLAGHRGRHPDLVLRWNAMPDGTSWVDVVVHFHGYSGHAAEMRLDVDKEPNSGLDFSNPDDPSDQRPGRRRPTLCVLPRGNFFGGRSGAGYDHPALITPSGLRDLIAFAFERFADATSARVSLDRLILTAHSGGGAGLIASLRHNDPHEVHVFDGLYGPADRLASWAAARIRSDQSGGAAGALRGLYIPGTGTAMHSLEVSDALRRDLAGGGTALESRYRVEPTSVVHNDIPRRFGWLLLADPGAQLSPGTRPARHSSPAHTQGVAAPDEPELRAQWEAHPRVHGWVDGGLAGYIHLAPLYARHGIAHAAAYLDQNIVDAHFFGRGFPTHREMARALARAEAQLRAAGIAPDVHSAWSVVARSIRGRSSSLSQHALGLAVDLNPRTNPLIRVTDHRDIVQVIQAVTGVDLGTRQPATVLRQASATFRATYGDDWLAARQRELDAADQGGDAERAQTLRAVLAAAHRRDRDLRDLARTGFLDLDQRLIDALVAAGLAWGGSWSTSKDFMHFELPMPAGPSTTGTGTRQEQPSSQPSPFSEPAPGPPPQPPRTSEPAPAPTGSGAARADPVQPPAGGWPMAPPPGTGTTLTPQQVRRIAERYRHVLAFYRRYVDLVMADQRATGVPATFTLAQGGVETGWGRSMHANMLFGVKANEHRVPLAERQLCWTSETVTDPHIYDGRYDHEPATPLTDRQTGRPRTDARGRPLYGIHVKQWFYRFATEADAIANHSRFLQRNRRYAEAFQHTDDPVAFARMVARAGYATGQLDDSAYERELLGAIDLVNRVAAYARDHADDPGEPPHPREAADAAVPALA